MQYTLNSKTLRAEGKHPDVSLFEHGLLAIKVCSLNFTAHSSDTRNTLKQNN